MHGLWKIALYSTLPRWYNIFVQILYKNNKRLSFIIDIFIVKICTGMGAATPNPGPTLPRRKVGKGRRGVLRIPPSGPRNASVLLHLSFVIYF